MSPRWRHASFARLVALALFALIALAAHAPRAGAQRDVGDSAAARATRDGWLLRVAGVSGELACACNSATLPVARERELYVVGIGLRRRLHSSGPDGAELDWDIQLLPLIVSRGTADAHLRVVLCRKTFYCATSDVPAPWSTTAVGAGLLPFGLTGLVPVAPRLRLLGRAAGGMLRLSQPVPVLEGHKFNFVAEASAGAELRISRHVAITGAWVLNHISNGGTSSINPGMNSRMLEVGLVRR